MLSLAVDVASLMEDLPVRIRASIVRRTLPFSTLTQFFAVGTNQLRFAARSFTLLPSRLVAFGMLPFAWSVFSASVLVKILIQSFASALSLLPFGTARSDPPRKPGIDWPALWPGITNCAVTFLNFLPTQQLNHAGPTIEAACPCAYTSYGCGRSSVPVLLAREVALKNRLYAARPLSQFREFANDDLSPLRLANAPAAMYFVISVFPISMTSGTLPPASVASNFWRCVFHCWYSTLTFTPGCAASN